MAAFALSNIFNSNLVKNPALWSDERLTPAGKAFVQNTNMASFLQLNLKNAFITPDKQPNWHIVDNPSQWSFRSLEKFVGMDYALDPFFDGTDYFYVLFYVALVAAAVVIGVVCLGWLFCVLLCSSSKDSSLDGESRLIVCIHSAFALVLSAQLVPYTVFALPVWFGPSVLGQLENHYAVPFTCVIMHGLLYVSEACVRASIRVSGLLLWHHILWLVMIFIAAFKKDVFAIKLDFILDYFVCWEFALYICLVAHRLGASLKVQKLLLILAALTYGLSAYSTGSHFARIVHLDWRQDERRSCHLLGYAAVQHSTYGAANLYWVDLLGDVAANIKRPIPEQQGLRSKHVR